MIRSLLQQHGLSPILKTYNASLGGHPTLAQGTVFIDAKSGSPLVYIETKMSRCNRRVRTLLILGWLDRSEQMEY